MKKVATYTLFTVFTVDLLATSGDISMSWTSPVLPKLYSNDSSTNPFDQPITSDQGSWIASLMSIGAMIGPFPYGFMAARFGRKIALLCIAVPHMVAYLTYAFSKSVYLYCFGRILNGIAFGGGYTLLPMYLAEVAEDSNRGMFSASLMVFWSIGNLLPYVLGPYMSILWFNVVLACIPTVFFVVFLAVAPESPYFLVMKNRKKEAEMVLMKLRSRDMQVVEKQLALITVELEKNDEKVTMTEFFKSKIYMKGLAISVILMAIQQLSGASAIVSYTQEIFESAGIKSLKPETCGTIFGSVTFVFSICTPLLVNRFGRRTLLWVSMFGCSITSTVIGTYLYLQASTMTVLSEVSWLPLVVLLLGALLYNTGLGILPWTLASELFPTNVKSYSATLASCTCWTTSFLVTKFFNDLKESLGEGAPFWLFGGSGFLGVIFTLLFVPETKGKSFQEIQDILGGKRGQ